MSKLFPLLFSPAEIGPVKVANRIVSSGHDTMLADNGAVSDELIAYQERRAAAGVGLIVLQVSGVHETARYTNHVLMATDDSAVDGYRRLADAVHKHGSKVFAQLFHPGREVMDGEMGMAPEAVAPSDTPQERFHVVPQPLTSEQIAEIIHGYGETAARIVATGIDGVEIVASHGYLPIQFVNPRVNTRTDDYGGSLDNRLRFLLESIEAVRSRVGEQKAVGLRISGDDKWAEGMQTDEFEDVIEAVSEQGMIDYLSVTAGDSSTMQGALHIAPAMDHEPGYVSSESQRLKKLIDKPVMVAGRINQPQEAEILLATEATDFCVMTRAMICDPEMPAKAAEDKVDDIRACIGCNQACIGHFQMGVPISCIQHPESGRELTFLPRPRVRKPHRVLVIGGGPGGLKAAAVAAEGGAEVLLVEQSRRLGGQVALAEKLPTRAEFGGASTNLEAEARRAGVDIRLNTEATQSLVDGLCPQHVVVATGSQDRQYGFEIVDEPVIHTVRELLENDITLPKGKVVVADWKGDWSGIGAALRLAGRNKVLLATAATHAGAAIQQYARSSLVGRAIEAGVAFLNDVRLVGVDGSSAYLQSTISDYVYDVEDVVAVVVAHAPQSVRPNLDLSAYQVHIIGDAKTPRTVEEAVYEGLVVSDKILREVSVGAGLSAPDLAGAEK